MADIHSVMAEIRQEKKLKIEEKNNRAKIISGQSNLTAGCIAGTHGWFSGIRQVVPVCTST